MNIIFSYFEIAEFQLSIEIFFIPCEQTTDKCERVEDLSEYRIFFTSVNKGHNH